MASVEENGLRIRWIGCRAVVETVEVERRMEVGYEKSRADGQERGTSLYVGYSSQLPCRRWIANEKRIHEEFTIESLWQRTRDANEAVDSFMEIDIGNVPVCLSSLSFSLLLFSHLLFTLRNTVITHKWRGEMIKGAYIVRDFLDSFHSSTLEHRSKGKESRHGF